MSIRISGKRGAKKHYRAWLFVFLLPIFVAAVGCLIGARSAPQPSAGQVADQASQIQAAPTADRQYVYGGLPRTTAVGMDLKVLCNKGYLVGYWENRKNPAWVAYRLFRVENPPTYPRPTKFLADNRTEAKVKPTDYTGSGYDRGHMAPNYAIATRYGPEAQLETFLMSNICPQRPALNQRAWKRLEEVEANDFANRLEEIWVLVGPIFGEDGQKLPSSVDVPKAFYKIMVDEVAGKPRMIAFIMPQEVKGTEPSEQFLASVNRIEKLTHLDFFWELEDGLEEKLEAETATDLW